MTSSIDRRSFLALGVGALAWACSRDERKESEPGDKQFSVVSTAKQGLAIGDTRQGFAIFKGQRPTKVEGLVISLAPPGRDPFEVEAEHVKIERGPGGDSASENTEVDDIYVVRHDFDRPGVWEATARFEGGRGKEVFQILDGAPAPIVGKKAIASKSPTIADPDDAVDPICTRSPICSLHDISIADAIALNKPAVLVFGTPRYCTSRTCGPVVDVVERAQKEVRDDASFIHIEQWKNDKSVGKVPKGLAPVFREWALDTEPWIYFIGTDGIVRDRWLGAVGAEEIVRATKALIAT